MPASLTYPGVYIEEIPGGVRTITGVATSITAFVGRAARGPVDEPVVISSFGEFERSFGGLWAASALGFAVRDFFLNGGGRAVIVRLFHPYYETEAAQEAALAAARVVARAAEDEGRQLQRAYGQQLAAAIGRLSALFKGDPDRAAAGAVAKAATDSLASADEPAKVALAARAAAEAQPEPGRGAAQAVAQIAETTLAAFAADAGERRVQAVVDAAGVMAARYTAAPEAERALAAQALARAQAAADLPGATPQTAATAALQAIADDTKVRPLADAAQIVVDTLAELGAGVALLAARAASALQAMDAAGAAHPAAREVADAIAARATAGRPAAAVLAALDAIVGDAAAPSRAQLQVGPLLLEAQSGGAWGNALLARVDYDVDGAERFNLAIRDGGVAPARVEYFRNLSLDARDARRVDKVLANESRLVRLLGELPAAARPERSATRPREDLWKPALCYRVTLQGRDGQALTADDFIGPGKEGAGTGLFALERADLFNLLCIPPHLDDGDAAATVITAAAAYCEQRRAILLVDPPASWSAKARVDLSKIDAARKNAALYFPRLVQPNPLHDGQLEAFAPCGAVAGVIARTDAQRGVWKAPAGQEATLAGVPKLSVPLTDAEIGELNPLGVNCLRAMPAAGRVIWGARTLDGADRLASEWKYLPVRRTALFIEESLYRGLQWAVFEPNDEELWSQLRLNVNAFMLTLFRRGAFQGATPAQAFFVKCDHDTNPQEQIDLGIVTVQVGFAPLRPAEFVVVQISQKAGQSS